MNYIFLLLSAENNYETFLSEHILRQFASEMRLVEKNWKFGSTFGDFYEKKEIKTPYKMYKNDKDSL